MALSLRRSSKVEYYVNDVTRFLVSDFLQGDRHTRNPYQILGSGLAVTGAVFAPIAYFLIASIPLTAIGISAVMLGFTSLALATARPNISPEASELILKTGMENFAAFLEELGLRNKAIYLPSSMCGGRPRALIPLKDTIELARIREKIPGRLIVHYGDNPDDMAIAVTTPGSFNPDKFEINLGPTPAEIESAMTYVLTGHLDLANSVTLNIVGNRVAVEVNGARLHYEDVWYYRFLGSPIASIVATITCEAFDKPVRIEDESFERRKSHIVLEVLS
jgi:hypothetical protein